MAAQASKPIHTTTTNTITNQSIRDLVSPSQTAMVYGFEHCKYTPVCDALSKKIDRVYDHSLDKAPQECRREYKAALVSQVIVNYKKQKLGIDITPIIFCIDLAVSIEDPQGNRHPLTSENLLSKTNVNQGHKVNDPITLSQLRRAYKLCYDEHVDPRIRAVARRTFKFARVSQTRTVTDVEQPDKIDRQVQMEYSLEQIPAPWEAPDFQTELARRKAYAAQHPVQRQPKPDWRAQVNAVCANDPMPSSGVGAMTKTTLKTIAAAATVGLLAYETYLARSYFG